MQPYTASKIGDDCLQGWEAIARLRVSHGLEVETHLGGAYRRSTTDLEFPAVSAPPFLRSFPSPPVRCFGRDVPALLRQVAGVADSHDQDVTWAASIGRWLLWMSQDGQASIA